MPLFEELRQAAPWAKDLSDDEIIKKGAELTGMSPLDVAKNMGVDIKASRNIAAVANDTVIETANAALGGIKTVSDFISPGNRVSRGLDNLINEGQAKQSYSVQEGKAKFNQAMESDDTITQLRGVKDYVLENPLQTAAQAVGTFATPGLAIKGTKYAGAALGLAEKGASRLGLATGVATSSAMSGGDAAGDAYDLVYNSPNTQNLSPEQRHAVATKAAREASVVPAAIGAAGGFFGADKALAMGTKSLLKTGLQEFGTEMVEEGSTKLSANLAARQYAPEVKPFTGVAGAAALGGILGGGTGLAVGAMTKQPVNNGSSLLSGGNGSSGAQDEGITRAINNIYPASDLSTQDVINEAMGIVEQTKKAQAAQLAQRQADMNAALNEPSGIYANDPITGHERELSRGEATAHQSQQVADANAQATEQQNQQQVQDKQNADHDNRMAVTKKYGGVQVIQEGTEASPHEGHWKFQGEDFFNVGDLQKKIETIAKIERTKDPLTLQVESALQDAGSPLKPGALRTMAAKYAGTTPAKVAYNLNAKLESLAAAGKGITDNEVTRLGMAYETLTGQVASGYSKAESNIDKSKKGATSASQTTNSVGTAQAAPAGEVGGAQGVQANGGNEKLSAQGASSIDAAPTGIREQIQQAEVAWADMDGTGTSFYDLPAHLQKEWIDEVSTGKVSGQFQEDLVNLSQNIGKDTANQLKIHNIAEEVLQHALPEVKGTSAKLRQRYRDFVTSYLDHQRDDKHEDIAAAYGVSLRTAQRWAALMPTFLEDNAVALKGAIDHVANVHAMSREKVLGLITNSINNAKIENNGYGVVASDGQSITNTKNNEGGADYENNQATQSKREADGTADTSDEAKSSGEIDVNDLVKEDSGINSKDRKDLSKSEWGNKTETTNQGHFRVLEKLQAIEDKKMALEDNSEMANEEKQDNLDVLNKQEEELLKKDKEYRELGKKNADANARKLRNAAAVDEDTGKAPEKRVVKKAPKVVAKIAENKVKVEEAKAPVIAREVAPKLWDKLADQINGPKFDTLSDKAKAEWIDHVETGNDKVKDMLTLLNRNKIEYSDAPATKGLREGSDKQKVKEEILAFIGAHNSSKLTVVQSASELPRDIQQSVSDKHPQGFVTGNGKAYLIADNIAPGQARAVFMHEVGSHLGLQRLLTDNQFDTLVDKITEWAGREDGSIESKIAVAALKRVSDAGTSDAQANTELLAYFLEEAINAGVNPQAVNMKTELGRWFTTLWAAFKNGIRKLGYNPDKLIARDIVDMAYGAARLELNGSWHGTAANFRKFSHEFMNTGEGAQAFGWGTYLAQRAGIAHGYFETDVKNKASEPQLEYKGKNFRSDILQSDPDADLTYALRAVETAIANGSPDRRIALRQAMVNTQNNIYEHEARLKNDLKSLAESKAEASNEMLMESVVGQYERSIKRSKGSIENLTRFLRVLKSLTLNDIEITRVGSPIGNLMRVDINATPDELLDFDKLLSKQPDILEKLEAGLPQFIREALEEEVNSDLADMDGTDVYFGLKAIDSRDASVGMALPDLVLTNKTRADEVVSKFLDSIGIKGNVFLDARSRKGEANATRNTVIYNDANIFRVASLPGANPEQIQFSFSESIKDLHETTGRVAEANIKKLPTQLQPAVSFIHSALFNIKKIGLGFTLTEDVAQMAKKYMPSVANFVAAFHEKASLTRQQEEHIQKIMQEADKLDDATRAKINEIVAESTIKNYWAFKPTLKDDTGALVPVTVNPVLAAKFNALPAIAQKVIKDIFQSGHDTLLQKKAAIHEVINTSFADRIKEAGNDEAAVKKLEKDKSLMLKRFGTILKIDPSTPYAPLKRFGSFIVVAESQAYKDAVEKKDFKWLEANQSNESHRMVEFASTYGEARAMQQELLNSKHANGKSTYASVEDPFEKSQARESLYGGNDLYKGFAKLQRLIRDSKGTEIDSSVSKISSKLESMVNDLYLTSLADSSARKSEMERKKIGGYNRDMLRAFYTQGMADAHYLANLKTSNKVLDSVLAMQNEAKKDRAAAYPYLNELMAHEADSLEVRPASMFDGVNRFTGDMFLTFSPGFYLQQSTQTYVLSLPHLAGKYGYFKSARMITAAYKDIFPLLKGTNLKEHMDLSNAPADVVEMLSVLVHEGKIDIGIEQEAAGFRSEKGSLLNPVNSYVKVTNALRGGINRVETINRSTAAIAAYRLEMQKSGNKTTAIDAARQVVHITHGSYDGFNTPRHMGKNAFTRSVTQFRRFQIIQLSMLAREFNAMLGKDATPLERKIAAKQFAFLFAHTAVLAGAKGVPLYALASLAYSLGKMIGGDDDDPEDLEAYLREHGGLLLTKGIPAALGLDLSNKLGMGNTMSILPYTDLKLTKAGAEKAVLGLMGPFIGGLMPKMVDGVGLMAKGDIHKGMEQVVPKGVGDGLKALRFATDGVTMRNGDQVLSVDEIGFADLVAQSLGLPTTKITERTYLQGELIKYEAFYKERTTAVKQDYAQSMRDGDTDGAAEARDDWNHLQAAKAENGFTKSPLSDLLKAPQAQAKREKIVVGGVAAKRNNKGFLQQRSAQ